MEGRRAVARGRSSSSAADGGRCPKVPKAWKREEMSAGFISCTGRTSTKASSSPSSSLSSSSAAAGAKRF
jgi:hypothetical protein